MITYIVTLVVPRKVGTFEQVLDVLARYRCKVDSIRVPGGVVDFYDITGVQKLSIRERRHMLWELEALGVGFLGDELIIG